MAGSQQLHVLGKVLAGLHAAFGTNHTPRCVDDLLLKLREFFGLLPVLILLLLLLLLLLATSGRFTFAKNLLERTHFGKEHIAFSPPRLSIGTDIFGPEVIREQLIGLRIQFFHCDHVINLLLAAACDVLFQHKILNL